MHTWYSAEAEAVHIREARLAEAAHERLLREARAARGAVRWLPAFTFWSPAHVLAALDALRRDAAGWAGARLIRLGEALQEIAPADGSPATPA
jgi:hypothetical protein